MNFLKNRLSTYGRLITIEYGGQQKQGELFQIF